MSDYITILNRKKYVFLLGGGGTTVSFKNFIDFSRRRGTGILIVTDTQKNDVLKKRFYNQ